MKVLDKSRPFGTVHGDLDGRRFVQDGVFFDMEGNEFGAPKTKPVSPKAHGGQALVAPSDVNEQLAKQ